eukprot:jgi/Undpi1/5886/HiC_scaffold_2.g01160.m1
MTATSRQHAKKMSYTLEDVHAPDRPLRTTHNPLFSSSVSAPKDSRLFPTAEEDLTASKVSSLVMRRHGRKDGRKDGASVDITRRRSGEQMERFKKAASAKQLRRVSSLDLPACVVVKSGDAADAGEVLQHCAFRMETFRVHNKVAPPGSASFLFVFNGGGASQSALEVTHSPRPSSAGSSPSNSGVEGRVTMTLGGMNVPHLPGEPYSCHIRQVGTVTFNPRKQAKGSYLYILSQEGRTLYSVLS